MALAGDTVIAGKVSGERIGTDVRTSTPATFTAETVVQSITVALVSGRTYKISYAGSLQSSVAADSARSRIREDSVSGTEMQNRRVACPNINAGFSADAEAEYTAAATANKTFVVTGERATGTGNISAAATGTTPTYLYVEYIRG